MHADEFLDSLTDEVLSGEDVAAESGVEGRHRRLMPAIEYLQSTDTVDPDHLLSVDGGRELASLLLGTPRTQVTSQSIRFGLSDWKSMVLGARLDHVVVGLLLADTQQQRGRWRRIKFEELVASQLATAVENADAGLRIRQRARLAFSGQRRQFRFVVTRQGRPFAAIQTIFQTTSGGRQLSIFGNLVDVQTNLADESVFLIVVADGPAFRSMRASVQRVAPQLQFLTNVSGVQSGELAEFLLSALHDADSLLAFSSEPDVRFTTITDSVLRTGHGVSPATLGTPPDRARAFFDRYIALNPGKPLSLGSDGALRSRNAEMVRAVHLAQSEARPDPHPLIAQLAEVLGWNATHLEEFDSVSEFGITMQGLRLRLPDPTPVFVLGPEAKRWPFRTATEIQNRLMTGPLVCRIGIVVAPGEQEGSSVSLAFSTPRGRAQFLVLKSEEIAELTLRTTDAARTYLTDLLVGALDLSLISPFQSEGPIPEPMFYGRRAEIQRITEHIRHQSFALIGGRKVGKTSILRRMESLLGSQYPVRYLDCQEVPDRSVFIDLLERDLNVPLGGSEASIPDSINVYLDRVFGRQFGVLLMDEIDQLFWTDADASRHAHLLSAALRAAVQSQRLSLIVTGERSIFRLIRHPASPHWNFCTPVMIGPLDNEPARSLLAEPLATLGLVVADDALDIAVNNTAAHPNLLQFLGERIVDSTSRESGYVQTHQANVTESTVSTLVRHPDFEDRFVQTYWSNATYLERYLSLLLAPENGVTAEKAVGILRDLGKSVRVNECDEAFQFLVLYSIASRASDGYRFRSPTFEQYFGILRNSLITDEWLSEIP